MADSRLKDLDRKNITVLCKVVDNYGDIGFVYRLTRRLVELRKDIELRLVVSNLQSFSSMAPEINPSVPVQKFQRFGNCLVLDWNDSVSCTDEFTKNPPSVILECFQCGRPDWLEDILFKKDRKDYVQIINVEYLTAEEWADDFHLLKGGTRSAFVKKLNFMPGFTSKTGGLVLDHPFMDFKADRKNALDALKPYLCKEDLSCLESSDSERESYNLLVFSYDRSFDFLVQSLQKFSSDKAVHVFAASGLSYNPFMQAYRKNKCTFAVTKLPYLPQNAWDALLTLTDFNFIRGEDSFSRACLSSVPFMWHVYVQDEEYQLVKLDAVLKRMEPFFCKEDYSLIRNFSLLYNRSWGKTMCSEAKDVWNSLGENFCAESAEQCCMKMEELFEKILLKRVSIKKEFCLFSEDLKKLGDLGEKLLCCIDEL